ncbi:MAG: adenylosuccinate lyase [Bacteroidales bacterium]|jgi:adenylosuccinate lyase|nr:adenylosuccinate lyase [Bacteroidales bacterium]
MQTDTLTAISPIDGRYYNGISALSDYFSELSLIKARVFVEIEYFIALCEQKLPQLAGIDNAHIEKIQNIYLSFSNDNALEIKEIEKTTNHDVKAVEYFLKKHFDTLGLQKYCEFIHFGLTSQDINNTAMPYLLKTMLEHVYFPKIETLTLKLSDMATQWKDVPMLARTHGQPASPTRLGKEIKVFSYRLEKQLNALKNIPLTAKFGGATGNFNAHYIAYPDIDWIKFANRFVDEKLGLQREQYTTQISNYDALAAIFDALKRINTILIDLCRDMWQYISMEYFKQQIKAGEVGSSAMPHKVNPIDFENAEGNLGIANALFEFLSAKLPISRLQRDLTDSTVTRNIGVPIAHSMIAVNSLIKGLNKLLLNELAIETDLQENWAVVAEAIQTILRREQYPQPYEALKALTRGKGKITQEVILQFIDTLDISDEVKAELKEITPQNYTGISPF